MMSNVCSLGYCWMNLLLFVIREICIHSFYFIKNIFIRTLRLRFAPKFKKMYGLKLEHPQAQPNCTCSCMKKRVYCRLKLLPFKIDKNEVRKRKRKNNVSLKKKKNCYSPAGNRTPVSRVTGGDTHHYTTEEDISSQCQLMVAILCSTLCLAMLRVINRKLHGSIKYTHAIKHTRNHAIKYTHRNNPTIQRSNSNK